VEPGEELLDVLFLFGHQLFFQPFVAQMYTEENKCTILLLVGKLEMLPDSAGKK
jgi:hypothetical protein